MSTIDAVSRTDYMDTANQRIIYSTLGYGSVGFTLAGTISSGNIKAYATNDGQTWTQIPIAKANNQLDDSTGITSAVFPGTFLVAANGYQQVSILASSDFVGNVIVSGLITTKVPQPFTVGV